MPEAAYAMAHNRITAFHSRHRTAPPKMSAESDQAEVGAVVPRYKTLRLLPHNASCLRYNRF
jgi:hypothetical protein